jgi:UDP-N-acetylglucosamine/UDP-N-acetylgalactosamine diphosphorylase
MQSSAPGSKILYALIERGVVVLSPASVEIEDSVVPERIAPGVVIHAGCRIRGSETSMGPGCIVGAEAAATVENCQLGREVFLGGGYFSGATFLDRSRMGSGAHVRAGTLLEEEASGAHTVGLKQTIFLPFVRAGSLINFCDCLMAGGTSRSNHSEIGSSYIHFNYTPRQDKATASLIGDVPRGVLLNQPPIFLGGQGGLVGPSRIAYGTLIAAGTICRQDMLIENQIYAPPPGVLQEAQKNLPGLYRGVDRIVSNNLLYIGNLHALKCWYRYARRRFMSGDAYTASCWSGAVDRIESAIRERVRRLGELAQKMPHSLELSLSEGVSERRFRLGQEKLLRQWPEMERALAVSPSEDVGAAERDIFLAHWNALDPGKPYLEAVAKLNAKSRTAASAWLQAIVDSAAAVWNEV